MNNITVLGCGVLGSQIAFQSAFSGKNVTVWLRSEGSIERAKMKLDNLKKIYIENVDKMNKNEDWYLGISDKEEFNKDKILDKINNVNINLTLDLEKAVRNKDLIIEATKEDLKEKRNLFKRIDPYLDEKTIVVTNSSSILPSKLSKFVKYENNFLALHFANEIWKNNTAEVMTSPKTSREVFDKVIKFAEEIKMIPLPIKKEKAGYLLNSMLIPFLFSALDLYANNISDYKSIDIAWTRGTGAPKGPFQILDVVGLKTAYNITLMYTKIPSFLAPYNFKKIANILKKYIDQGKLGVETKEGFYKY